MTKPSRAAVRACRQCGCTDARACPLPNGDTCAWVPGERDLCTAPKCMKAARRAIRREATSLRKTLWRIPGYTLTDADCHLDARLARRERLLSAMLRDQADADRLAGAHISDEDAP